MNKLSLFCIGITYVIISSCGESFKESFQSEEFFEYKEVTIGNQVWMTENLNVDKFQNGDLIPEVKSKEEWEKAGENKQPAWCYYDNAPFNGKTYGKLYNWYAVNDIRGLAPKRWHIPSDAEWIKLITYLGTSDAGVKMKSTKRWLQKGYKNNESGFSGLPSGYRDYDGYFYEIGKKGDWWCTNKDTLDYGFYRCLIYNNLEVGGFTAYKKAGLSVRCLKNK